MAPVPTERHPREKRDCHLQCRELVGFCEGPTSRYDDTDSSFERLADHPFALAGSWITVSALRTQGTFQEISSYGVGNQILATLPPKRLMIRPIDGCWICE